MIDDETLRVADAICRALDFLLADYSGDLSLIVLDSEDPAEVAKAEAQLEFIDSMREAMFNPRKAAEERMVPLARAAIAALNQPGAAFSYSWIFPPAPPSERNNLA
jgi:hypothetical protein